MSQWKRIVTTCIACSLLVAQAFSQTLNREDLLHLLPRNIPRARSSQSEVLHYGKKYDALVARFSKAGFNGTRRAVVQLLMQGTSLSLDSRTILSNAVVDYWPPDEAAILLSAVASRPVDSNDYGAWFALRSLLRKGELSSSARSAVLEAAYQTLLLGRHKKLNSFVSSFIAEYGDAQDAIRALDLLRLKLVKFESQQISDRGAAGLKRRAYGR
jgi:hypothetical protein